MTKRKKGKKLNRLKTEDVIDAASAGFAAGYAAGASSAAEVDDDVEDETDDEDAEEYEE